MKNLITVLTMAFLVFGFSAVALPQDLELGTPLANVFVSAGGRLVLSNPSTLRGMNRWAFLNLAVDKSNVYNFDDSIKTIATLPIDSTSAGRKANYVLYKVTSPASGTLGTSPSGSKLHHIMTVYVWKDLKGVIVAYRFKNTGATPVTGKISFELYPRIDQSYSDHNLRWRSQDSIAYFFRGTLAHFLGAKYVSGVPTGVRLSAGTEFYVSGSFAEDQPDSVRFNAASYRSFDLTKDSPAGTRSMIHINNGEVTIGANDSSATYYYAMAYDVTEAGMVQAIKEVETRARTVGLITAVKIRDLQVPSGFALQQNYPNPFNPTTQISFTLEQSSFVSLKVYEASGREVRTLVQGTLPAGSHLVPFEATGLTSGVYFYTLRANGFAATRKMLLIQ
ncbi:MAG: T9SS type A sorting domain-containing protein [candidate division KSB1 bacterium]|nr:T9SS type A sorting domain-containing protein [candidate division KSB1 bacterium]MDZ7368140.1 T9SS type A sorting domain-containing protein [candidate division KSB1 bacterium]MDZ7405818.1 T9SS type A sorting domain-containing protein [candidate division KSB1 bacterium]